MLTEDEALARLKQLKAKLNAHETVVRSFMEEMWEYTYEIEDILKAYPDIEKKEYPEWLQALMS